MRIFNRKKSKTKPRRGSTRARKLSCEALEVRRLLFAEGDVFNFGTTLSSAGLVGDVSAIVRWGDGVETPASSVTGGNATGPLRIRFDYSLDTGNFFGGANQSRRALLQLAADTLVKRFTDDLAAIVPTGKAEWQPAVFHPSNGPSNRLTGTLVNVTPNLRVAANEIIIYAGARDLPGGSRGVGGLGSISFPSASGLTPAEIEHILDFRETVSGRGEPGALASPQTDVAPWGGSISFDNRTDWYFGVDASGMGEDQIDFISVAMHELAHVLGFGMFRQDVTTSWDRLVSGGTFNGPKTRAAYQGSGNVPVEAGSNDHWADSVADQLGQETLMSGHVDRGSRHLFSELDFAAMDDIGWDVVNMNTRVTGQHRYGDNGTFPVEVVLRGSRAGEIVQQVTSLRVNNIAPKLTVPSTQAAVANQLLTITDVGSIVDPGYINTALSPFTRETFNYTINWGDGSDPVEGLATIDTHGNATTGAPTLASFNGTHRYTSSGTFRVDVRVEDDDGGVDRESFQVVVTPPPALSVHLSAQRVPENGVTGSTTLTVRRSGPPIEAAQTITLVSSDTSEARLPPSVMIPAGATEVSVPVQVVDDALLDGDVTVQLSANASGLDPAAIDLVITDHEALSASFTADSIREDASGSVRLRLHRSNFDVSSPLVVNVAGGLPNQLELPDSVTIPAGSQVLLFSLTTIDDDVPEPPRLASFSFSAAGYQSGTASVELQDDEPPIFQNPVVPFDVDGNGTTTANDALRIINEIARRGGPTFLDPATEQTGGMFLDVSGDYQLTARDALLVINELSRKIEQASSGGELAEVVLGPIDQPLDDDDDDFVDVLGQ